MVRRDGLMRSWYEHRAAQWELWRRLGLDLESMLRVYAAVQQRLWGRRRLRGDVRLPGGADMQQRRVPDGGLHASV